VSFGDIPSSELMSPVDAKHTYRVCPEKHAKDKTCKGTGPPKSRYHTWAAKAINEEEEAKL